MNYNERVSNAGGLTWSCATLAPPMDFSEPQPLLISTMPTGTSSAEDRRFDLNEWAQQFRRPFVGGD